MGMLIKKKILLVPLAMTVPTKEGIYSISNYQFPIEVSKEELKEYSSVQMKVSPEETLFNELRKGIKPTYKMVTAYGKGLSCWYIAVEDK